MTIVPARQEIHFQEKRSVIVDYARRSPTIQLNCMKTLRRSASVDNNKLVLDFSIVCF